MTQTLNFISPKYLESPSWGPTGREVYERTYQRVKSDGTRESWEDTVRRVVKGNLALVPEHRTFPGEEEELFDLIYSFRGVPAGRQLWMSGVEGRQFLFNCYVSGWGDKLSDHFAFTFNQLMEGGGVGANYSSHYLRDYRVFNLTRVHIICADTHPNYQDLVESGTLSSKYTFDSGRDDAFIVEDSREGWIAGLRWLIDIAASPSYDDDTLDLVLDVSDVRAAGLPIKTFGGTSAGPVPYAKLLKEVGHLLNDMWENGVTGPICMEVDHAIATCVVSGNVRRSARMSQMHWEDPYIEWFLTCKESGLSHWSTNISVEIDDDFIRYINLPSNDGDPRADRARKVYQSIVEGMLRNGEPGIWNSSLANVAEPNRVIATNPCGEICLEDWENCNLGHINLDSFVRSDGSVDYGSLVRAHELMARFLIRSTYGDITDPKTRAVVERNRRIGVGHFGFAGFVAKQEIRFSESWKPEFHIPLLLSSLKNTVRSTAERYAHELRIPNPVKLTTVAPTGTIAKLAGRSEGIHPVYARFFIRRIRYSTVDPAQSAKIEEYLSQGYRVVPDVATPYTMVVEIPTKEALVEELEKLGIDPRYLEDASEISLENHLRVQEMYQTYWADNAVSYTVNLDTDVVSQGYLAKVLQPFLNTLKGTTIFPEKGYELAPYERIDESRYFALRGSHGATEVSDSVDLDCASGACPVR